MTKSPIYVLLFFCLLIEVTIAGQPSVDAPQQQKKPNSDWEVLFDGRDLSHWRSVLADKFPEQGWVIENQSLTVLSGKKGGDIITRKKYGNFELELDFNLTVSGNTGIKYLVQLIKNSTGKKIIGMGPEYQLIDDFNHPEVKDHKHDEGATAALYLLYAPGSNKKLLPPGQWNHVKIIARGTHIEHWLNGKMVVSYERGSDDFRQRVSQTKFSEVKGYGEDAEGYILLQDHGDKASFKNIRIRRL